MTDTNMTTSAIAASPQQVQGRSLFWAIVTVALAAISQTSVVADYFNKSDIASHAILTPYASSPVNCVLDSLFEVVVLLRYTARATGLWRPKSTTLSASEPSSSQPVAESSAEEPARQLVAARIVLFTLAVLPQVIKIFSMRGIPVTHTVVACFLAPVTTRLLCTLVGRRLEGDKLAVYDYRRFILRSRLCFETITLVMQTLLSSVVWFCISCKLSPHHPDVIATLDSITVRFPVIYLLFMIPHIIWCSAILMEQRWLLQLWPIPLSPMALCIPPFYAWLTLRSLDSFELESTKFNIHSSWNTMFLGLSTALWSYVVAALSVLCTGRFTKDKEEQSTQSSSTGSAVEAATSQSSTPSGAIQDSSSGNGPPCSTPPANSPLPNSVAETAPLPTSPSNISWLPGATNLSRQHYDIHSLPPINRSSTSTHMRIMSAPESHQSINLAPGKLTSAPKLYRTWAHLVWHLYSISFSEFRESIPAALKTTWAATPHQPKTLPEKIKLTAALLAFLVMRLSIQLFVFSWFAFESCFDYGVVFKYISVIKTRYDDTLFWTTLAIFNLATAAAYYLAVFDGTGTVNPGWTSWLGK